MPSFDVVSDFDKHEATNAIDQSNREVNTRFDFKGTGSEYTLDTNIITLKTQSEFQLKQMIEILRQKLSKRGINIECLNEENPEVYGDSAIQKITMRRGIDKLLAKTMISKIKKSKLKVQTSIQGDMLRITGKKRDDLQKVISFLKTSNFGLPLQYKNLRD